MEILRRRLDLTEGVLNEELKGLRGKDSALAAVLFGEDTSDSEKRRRLAHEIGQIEQALAKVQADRKQLDKLAARPFDGEFLPKLRRLEGADFTSPFNFAWHLDFAGVFRPEQGGFDIIVGNPPFVTARNAKKNDSYRQRWKRVCSGKYLLICPFLDLSFSLLRCGGQLGFIVSNAFVKREFGKPLIEDFFPTVDLQKVIDCAGLLFPGHGTPTCLIFGVNQQPVLQVPIRVAAILPGGGDLRTPPEDSPLWNTLSQRHDQPGYADPQVVVADRSRGDMAKWPWSLDAGAAPTKQLIESPTNESLLQFLRTEIGFDAITAANDIYHLPPDCLRRAEIPLEFFKQLIVGELLRNYETDQTAYSLWPYKGADARPELHPSVRLALNPFRAFLEVRSQFRETQLEAGLKWFEFREYHRHALKPQLTYAKIATHLHVCYSEGERVFNEHAPIIEPRSNSVADHQLLAGLLNSSAALFWIKQIAFNKGAGKEEERDRFELLGGKVQQLPVAEPISAGLMGAPNDLVKRLTQLSRECWERGKEGAGLALRKVFEQHAEAYHAWNSSLRGSVVPHAVTGKPFATADDLRAALKRVHQTRERLRAEMVARQEEMDWLVYAAYGLIPDAGAALSDEDLSLPREQRPFYFWAQAEEDFARAVQLIPSNWSAPRRALWEVRLRFIRDNEHVHRIEQPVYKRRWDEQWKIGNTWQCGQPAYDAEFLDAFAWWLAEKAEWWLEEKRSGGPVALLEWTDALWTDPRVQAAWTVAAETSYRLDRWKQSQNDGPDRTAAASDAGRPAFLRYFKALVKESSVPEDLPFAVPWEELEKTHKVPAAVKKVRGKLNVPRERFWVTATGQYRQARPLE